MRKLRRPGAVMGLFTLVLEATGVASGAYVYGDFPIKILGVPLCIPIMWVLVMALAYMVSERYGPTVGVLAICSVDLILEPFAYITGIWTWLEPYTAQIYFGSTIANALVWGLMGLIGIKLWERRSERFSSIEEYAEWRDIHGGGTASAMVIGAGRSALNRLKGGAQPEEVEDLQRQVMNAVKVEERLKKERESEGSDKNAK